MSRARDASRALVVEGGLVLLVLLLVVLVVELLLVLGKEGNTPPARVSSKGGVMVEGPALLFRSWC
jgi:hypothetical protein